MFRSFPRSQLVPRKAKSAPITRTISGETSYIYIYTRKFSGEVSCYCPLSSKSEGVYKSEKSRRWKFTRIRAGWGSRALVFGQTWQCLIRRVFRICFTNARKVIGVWGCGCDSAGTEFLLISSLAGHLRGTFRFCVNSSIHFLTTESRTDLRKIRYTLL